MWTEKSPVLVGSPSAGRGRASRRFLSYVLPEQRHRAFDLYEAFDAGKPQYFEIQSNDLLLAALTLASRKT